MRIYPLIFDSMLIFKIKSCIFTPFIFSQCVKEKVLLFWNVYLLFCVVLNIDLVVICYCLWYYIAKNCFCNTTCIITQRKPLTICLQTDRQMDFVNSEFYIRYNFANQNALLWTPNAYWDILMRIFTPCLFSQCVFTYFQCVTTLICSSDVVLFKLF